MSRILLIDDNDSFRETLHRTLSKLGHEVWEAPNGSSATKLIAQHAIEVVLTDLVMPEQEGLETIQVIRRTTPTVKIVAISGGSRNINPIEFLKMAKMLGADRTLPKPFSTEDLKTVLASFQNPAPDRTTSSVAATSVAATANR